MDKLEAIRGFIRETTSLETMKSDPFSAETFKKLMVDYFVGEKSTHLPKNEEIATTYIRDSIRNSQVRDKDQLDELFRFPFFQTSIPNKQLFYELLEKNKQVDSTDYAHLKREEYRRKIMDELKEEALDKLRDERNKEIQELDARIQAKKDEYASLPSILDSPQLDTMIPPTLDREEVRNQFLLWYKSIGLVRNPFPEDFSDYRDTLEKIVQKTAIYVRYERLIVEAPEELFRNTIFYGEFGSGKTTFFDFISLKLHAARIRPFYIQIYGEFDIYSMVFSFKRKLLDELERTYVAELNQRPIFLEPSNIDQQIQQLLKELSARHTISGFIIFIDDLHRTDNLEIALNFISQLQTTRDDIRRKMQTVKIGFYLSGSPEMERMISKNPKYSAAIQQIENMPPITVDIALEAINRRLRVFSRNQSNPRQVDRIFIERIIKSIELSEQPVTFRTVIRTVKDEFDQGRFTGFNVDPTKILKSTLDGIRAYIDQYSEVRSQLHRFLNGPARYLTHEQRNYCLLKVVEIYLQGQLEESRISEKDMYYLRLLNNATLIVKTRGENELAWRISYSLAACNNDIIRKYGISLEDYLVVLYGTPSAKGATTTIRKEVEEIDSMLVSMPKDSVYEQFALARSLHSEVLDKKDEYFKDERMFGKLLSSCSSSLSALTKAYIDWEGISRNIASGSDTPEFWKEFWYTPSALEVYYRIAFGDEEKRKRVHKAVGYYLDAVPQLIGFIRKQREKAKLLRVPLRDLKNDEIRGLNECLDRWMLQDYVGTVELLSQIIDKKLSALVFDIFTILYGVERTNLLVPDELRRVISDGFSAQIGTKGNDAYSDARQQYCEILTGDGVEGHTDQHWDSLFEEIFHPWTRNEVTSFLNDFIAIGEKTSHTHGSSLAQEDKDNIFRFLKSSCNFLIQMNQAYLKLINGKYAKSVGDMTIFSFCEFKDEQAVLAIRLDEATEAKLWEVVRHKGIFKCRLDAQDYVQDGFGTDYRTFCAFLSAACNGRTQEGRRLVVERTNGSDVYLRAVEKVVTERIESRQNPKVFALVMKPLSELFADKESTILEFKSSLRYPTKVPKDILALKTQLDRASISEKDGIQDALAHKERELQSSLEKEVVEGIACFLNTDGGLMIIGYDDDEKKVIGLENDFLTFASRRNMDGWLQHLTNLLSTNLGVNCTDFVRIEPAFHDSMSLAKVIVNPSPIPFYLQDGKETMLCVRFINVTRKLRGREMVEYVRHHWSK